jgi:hypothetical protein
MAPIGNRLGGDATANPSWSAAPSMRRWADNHTLLGSSDDQWNHPFQGNASARGGQTSFFDTMGGPIPRPKVRKQESRGLEGRAFA